MAEKNYYDILGIKKDASDADIKKKYRKLVRQYHPDVSDDPDADNKIAEINNAYETLRDKDKRSEYDAMLDNPFAGQAGAGGFGGQSAGAQGGFRWEDIKDQFGDGEAFGGGEPTFGSMLAGRLKTMPLGTIGSEARAGRLRTGGEVLPDSTPALRQALAAAFSPG